MSNAQQKIEIIKGFISQHAQTVKTCELKLQKNDDLGVRMQLATAKGLLNSWVEKLQIVQTAA